MSKIRGFELISKEQFKKDFQEYPGVNYDDLELPRRSTARSAGYDFILPMDKIKLKPGESVSIPTGIKSYMKKDEVLLVFPRSGHGFKFFIRLANTTGIVDSDFYNNKGTEGHIFVKIRNEGNKDFEVEAGDAFCQGVFQQYLLSDGDDFNGPDRVGGFGSTDK